MSEHQIVKRTYNDRDPYVVDAWHGSRDEAVEYARLKAEEHYDRNLTDNGSLKNIEDGAEFVTNNGTPVSYRVG